MDAVLTRSSRCQAPNLLSKKGSKFYDPAGQPSSSVCLRKRLNLTWPTGSFSRTLRQDHHVPEQERWLDRIYRRSFFGSAAWASFCRIFTISLAIDFSIATFGAVFLTVTYPVFSQ